VNAENVELDAPENPTLPRGDYIRVRIADPGGGITKEVLPKIFDPYFSTKQRGDKKGMGLGLTICHAVIQKHGGAITVESEGVGTTFHILLPAARHWNLTTKAVTPKILPRPGRILAMDDDEAMRNVIETALQQMGHDVELAEDGEAAVDAYIRARRRGRPFDAVLLDLTVRAGVGGQEAVRALLLEDPAVNAIVMSGYANDPVVRDPEKHGFKGVLFKPFDIAELQELLARTMRPVT
jgi:CheY-like chemotaxis protein